MQLPRNPAALRALLDGDEKNYAVANMPGGIEAQEALAQQDLVSSQKLPKEGTIKVREYGRSTTGTNQAQLEKLGFVFGAEIDDLFVSCQFPQGWSIKPTDHSMWSYVYDDKGRKRIAVFYKGAFYDRRAHANMERRYFIGDWNAATPDEPEAEGAHSHEEWLTRPQCMVVRDHDGAVLYHSMPYTQAEREGSHFAEQACRDWLQAHYPDYENPFAYWVES